MWYRTFEWLSRTPLRKRGVAVWYELLSHLSPDYVTFLNYGLVLPAAWQLALESVDEPQRCSIALYHYLIGDVSLTGRDVLEVGCGRGGGAAFVAKYHRIRSLTAIDAAKSAISFCRRRHRQHGLAFEVADAERLPFGEAQFDVVLNVESSHAYLDFPGFLRQVQRVLRDDGVFLFCDVRPAHQVAHLRSQLANCGMQLLRRENISELVRAALVSESRHRCEMIEQNLPRPLWPLLKDFAGVADGRVYNSFGARTRQYLLCTMRKRSTSATEQQRVRFGARESFYPLPPK